MRAHLAGEHLVHNRAQRPPINFEAVRHAFDHLGGQIFWCATKCSRFVPARLQAGLRQTEVGQPDVTWDMNSTTVRLYH